MQTVFAVPVDLKKLSDDEFWSRMDQLDEIAEANDLHEGGFAVTLHNGDKQVAIPFIRFKRTFPQDAS